jgi:mannose-6-phosphate isomerase-like protein (cupin superfamily)
METQERDRSLVHRRGGQSSFLLLTKGQFGSQHLAVTWVDCPPGSRQEIHRHDAEEQVYVIVRGRGTVFVGDDEKEVAEGTLVYIPPGSDHAIINKSDETMCYVSATSPPFDSSLVKALYEEP